MQAAEMTFGIEIESTVPAGTVQRGEYHDGIQVPWLPNGWNAQKDGSLNPAYGRDGVEFVSPILRGAAGLREALEAIEAIKAHGATVNPSCGFHVHVGFPSNSLDALRRLVHLVACHERGIFATSGTKAREMSRFCKPIKNDFKPLYYNARRGPSGLGAAAGDRFHILNLANLVYGRKPTVEFRTWQGTLNVVKAAAYIQLAIGLVELAINTKKAAKWDAQPGGPWVKPGKGAGATEVLRLMYRLGWIKGHTERDWGMLGAGPSRKEMRHQLQRLADKYDGPVAA